VKAVGDWSLALQVASCKVYHELFLVMYAIGKIDVQVKASSSANVERATKGVAILPNILSSSANKALNMG
jgi:hypothetical protein